MIRVLVVEDSPTMRELLVQTLSTDAALQVVGTATNGEEALKAVARLNPDVVTMDIVMPRVDGLEATRRIMQTQPTPIVIVSSHLPAAEARASFRALEAGALAVMPRPAPWNSPSYQQSARDLVRTVKLMAEVKVVRRWPRVQSALTVVPPHRRADSARQEVDLVVIGGSTGAPAVLETILARLPKPYPLPMVVVQHMAPGFIDGFAEWLGQAAGQRVKLAEQRERLQPGVVYLAPDGYHLGLSAAGQVELSQAPAENGLRPAVAFLFRSAAVSFGARAAGVLLTGMGNDGAAALKLMQERGAVTIVQDRASSIVHGMPGEAIKLGAAGFILPPEEIAELLAEFGKASVPRRAEQ